MKSENLYIIGVDPGLVTGIAIFARGWAFSVQTEIPAAEVDSYLREHCRITREAHHAVARDDPYFIFAVERYVVGGNTVKMTRQPEAQQVTGVVQAIAAELGGTFTLQNAADAKKMGSRKALFNVPGFLHVGRHAQDAASQAYLALSRFAPDVIDKLTPR